MEDEGHKTKEEKLREIEGSDLLPNRIGGLSITHKRSNTRIDFTQRQTVELAMAACEHIAEIRQQSGQRNVLLIGGPYHGEWKVIPYNQNAILFEGLDKFSWKANVAECPTVSVGFTQHLYQRVADFAIDGVVLPFEIYEHGSLREANVARNARLLDEEIEVSEIQRRIAEDDIRNREHNVRASQGQLDLARSKAEALYTAGSKLVSKRLDISYKDGV